ncbi:MFS transporter [Pseudomonas bharatica]|uniref:MFS transporter n=1 Tax=Pseudomonas bharatica TaxID=2692112 RepID=UPI0028999F0C|nr:MFS transporter [Pseudomonas bharatica]
MFIAAIGLFVASSLACALSASLWQLALARFCQGMAAALMVPVGQVILLRWSSKGDLLKAMAYLTMPALLGPVFGPPLGGLLVTGLSWHWIFLLNLPSACSGYCWCCAMCRTTRGNAPARWTARLPARQPGAGLPGAGIRKPRARFVALGMVVPVAAGRRGFRLRLCAPCTARSFAAAGPVVAAHSQFCPGAMGRHPVSPGSASLPFLLVLLFQLGYGMSALQAGC